MPNHCTNILSLKDSKKEIQEVIKPYLVEDDQGSPTLSFDRIIPMPKELRKTSSPSQASEEEKQALIEKYGADNWYDWACTNWGTKWDSYDNNIGDESLLFMTAWSPPIPVIEKLSQLCKTTLVLRFLDEGYDFCGEFLAYPNGTTSIEEFSPAEDAPEELLEALGYEPYEEIDEDIDEDQDLSMGR